MISHVPGPLAQVKAYLLFYLETKSFSKLSLLPDFFGFLEGAGFSPSRPLWTVSSSLPQSQLLLPSYLCRIKRKNSVVLSDILQCLRTSSAGSNSPPSGLFRIWASPARHLWHHYFHFWPPLQTLGRGPTVGSPWSSSTPLSLGRDRVAPSLLLMDTQQVVTCLCWLLILYWVLWKWPL